MRWIWVASLALAWGCDDGGDGAGDCEALCVAKLAECGAQGPKAGSKCAFSVCTDKSEERLTCVRDATCNDIGRALLTGMLMCDVGEDTGGCPELSGCACGSGTFELNGECATTCEEACPALNQR